MLLLLLLPPFHARSPVGKRTSSLPYLAVTPMPPVEPCFLPRTSSSSPDPLAHPTQELLLPTAIAVARIPSGSVQIFTHFIYIHIYVHTHQVFRRFSGVHMQRYIHNGDMFCCSSVQCCSSACYRAFRGCPENVAHYAPWRRTGG